MFRSYHVAHLTLRIALAVVFLWFGADKFIDPEYWLNAWVPQGVVDAVARIGMSGRDLVFLNGLFEILVAVSLVSGYFIRIFASAAILFLIIVTSMHGFNEVLVRDIGLAGGLLALAVWPERTGW